MAVILLIGVVGLFLFSYHFIDQDFLSPINLYLLFSIASVAGMFLMYNQWNLNEYGVFTTLVYLVGSATYALGCWMARGLASHNINRRYASFPVEEGSETRIEVSTFKLIIIFIICLLSLYGMYSYVIRVGGTSLFSLAQLIQNYRNMRSQGTLIGENGRGAIWNLLTYMSRAFAYCSVFVLIKNSVNKQFKKKDVLLLTPVFMYSAECLLQSNRGGIIQIFFAAIISWFISTKYKDGWKERVNAKSMKIVARIAIILIPIFCGSLILLGRYSTLKGFDFKNYSLVYLSGGVRNLDQFLKEPTAPPTLIGEETFVTLHRNMYIKGTNLKNVVRYLEFRKINGKNIGNIYTAYRRFYHDFGMMGILILPWLQGIMLSLLYYKIDRTEGKSKLNFYEVIYCYLSYTVIYIVIDDLFFSTYFSFTGIKVMLIMFIAYFFIFNISSEKRWIIKMDLGPFTLGR